MNAWAAGASAQTQGFAVTFNRLSWQTSTQDTGSKGTHQPGEQERRTAANMKGQDGQSVKHMEGPPGIPG